METITILGAGNMGHVLAGKFSQTHDVCVYLNELEQKSPFDKNLKVFCEDSNSTYEANIKMITTSLEEALNFGTYIFITYPAFLFKKYSELIIPFLTKKHHLFFVPGSGGAELYFKSAIEKGCTITGLQRVHSVARIIKQGFLVKESGIRKELKAASVPNSFNSEACNILSNLYSLPVEPLDNYLNVTLVNSNPILHTSRLYSVFKDFPKYVAGYKTIPLFYENWDLPTSLVLNKMDSELFSLFGQLGEMGLEIKQITTLLQHYESKNEQEMVSKITSIQSLKGLTTPSVVLENGEFGPDLKSRYFTADFPFGLDILISFCEFFDILCPMMATVSDWYHGLIFDKRTFSLSSFFSSKNDLIMFYL